jgi:hypothetical protein
MPMTPFVERFPDVGPRETRSATVPDGQDIPKGEYGFLELYCDEPDCDCRRATIVVLRPETGWRRIYATISYGWEDPDFYRKWGPHSDPQEMSGPSLNPLGPQTKYSPALLDLFRLLIQSPDYVERLKRHYRMFRESVDREHGRSNRPTSRVENRRKRRRPHTR